MNTDNYNTKNTTHPQQDTPPGSTGEHNRMFGGMPPTRLFFRCAIPNMISMAVVSMYPIADGIFVGYYIGAEALAAINLVMPLIMMSFAFSDMVAVGSSVQIAIWLGKKDERMAGRIFSTACLLILISALVMGTLAWLFSYPLVHLLGASGEVADLAVKYMRVYAAFSVLIMHFFAVDNYLRICGKVHYSMAMNVGMSLANIVLDWLFIGVLGWGIESAALASCLSLMCGNILCFLPFFAGKLPLHFMRQWIRPGLLGNIIANGSSEFFNNISGSVCMIIFNAALLSAGGFMAVAAFSIIMYVDSVVKALLFGMGDALQPAISYNYGAGSPARIWAIERRVQAAGLLLALLVLAFMQLGGEALIGLFAKEDAELLSISVRGMRLFSLSYLFTWCAILSGSYFTALNRPVFSLMTAAGQTLLFPVLFLSVLPRFLGLDGIWLSPVLAGAASFLVCLLFLLDTSRRLSSGSGQQAQRPL